MAGPGPRSSPAGSRGRRARDPEASAVVRRRIAAALVDIALVEAALLAVLRVGGHPVPAVTPGASLAFSLIPLVYYFAGEAATGQTLGKHVFGLEVRRVDGSRADQGKILIRTLFRLVDSLPLLYALGFVVMEWTERRQRIGDIFADTVVVRRSPP